MRKKDIKSLGLSLRGRKEALAKVKTIDFDMYECPEASVMSSNIGRDEVRENLLKIIFAVYLN